MRRKPEKGEALLLLARTRAGKDIYVPVECLGAFDRDDTLLRGARMLARQCPVTVLLHDGTPLEVTRGDVEPADPIVAEREAT